MSVLSDLLSWFVHLLSGLSGTRAYELIAVVTFLEASAFVGFFLPGEYAVLLGGVLAQRGAVSLPMALAVAVLGTVGGDSLGYLIGDRLSGPLLATRFATRRAGLVAEARDYVERRGGLAVFAGRWTLMLRSTVPLLAGMSGMRYRRFLLFNATGGASWAVTLMAVGYLAGVSYDRYTGPLARVSAVILLALVVGVVLGMRRHRRRARHLTTATMSAAPAAATTAE